MEKIAIPVSGSGTLLERMIKDELPIELVIGDRPCRGFDLAQAAGISTNLIDRTAWGWDNAVKPSQQSAFQRSKYSFSVANAPRSHGITVAAMAGFMTILDPTFFGQFKGTPLNIHPALLPNFKGEHAVRDALAAGVTETGTTIHVATEQLDEGPILVQGRVSVQPGDTEESLHERIKQVERPLYSALLKYILHHGVPEQQLQFADLMTNIQPATSQ